MEDTDSTLTTMVYLLAGILFTLIVQTGLNINNRYVHSMKKRYTNKSDLAAPISL